MRIKIYPWLIFFLSACFLFYKYVLQVSPSVMAPELMQTFSLSGTLLGVLAGSYFYTYLIMQIPSGILLDRFGPRKISTMAILFCALGILIFSQTHSFYIACFARMMIGFGAAFGTTSYMKLASRWFPASYFPILSGFFGTACMLGAGSAGGPLALLVGHLGWRGALLICAIAGLILTGLFFLIIRDKPNNFYLKNNQNFSNITENFDWRALFKIFKNKSNWALIAYGGLAFTPASVFGGLWGVPYLMASENLSRVTAASMTSLTFFGFAAGGLLIGLIAKWIPKLVLIMAMGTFLALIFLALILYCPDLPKLLLSVFIFLFGFCSSSFLLSYSVARNINSLAIIGTVIGVINMGDPLCGSFAEPMIGKILDLNWSGELINNTRVFSIHAYHLGLSVLLGYALLAVICCLFIKDKEQDKKY